ncbi:MAG: hypothetical protein R3D03_14375 [Geminicoccaceae bacterium]
MSERAGILDELAFAQLDDIVDSLDRRRVHVGGELLVAKELVSLSR